MKLSNSFLIGVGVGTQAQHRAACRPPVQTPLDHTPAQGHAEHPTSKVSPTWFSREGEVKKHQPGQAGTFCSLLLW